MTTIEAKFDGKQVILPDGVAPPPVGTVYVVFGQDDEWDTQDPGYQALVQEALAKVWDNPDDDIYNDL